MANRLRTDWDIVVVGGGHAGVEAARAAGAIGARVALVTLDPAKIGVMSCNPAIGGLAKGQIVREVDAMGGAMGLAADASGVNFKVLNQSRGPAVRGPRAQCDRHAYAAAVRSLVRGRPRVTVIAGSVEDVFVKEGALRGAAVRLAPGGETVELSARALVLTTGTFMRGLMHTGQRRTPGGRAGEAPSVGVSASLERLGFELGRLKTGTPPRLARGSIDWESLEPQLGDDDPLPFSDLTPAGGNPLAERFPAIGQLDCRITSTTPAAHDLIRANIHRAPMHNGQLESTGPRYCPSIEDKIVRFADKQSHHVFLEPESHVGDTVYCNGIATSLPEDVQRALVRSMPGCAAAEIVRYGYAVEYDCVRPHQIDATCMTKRVGGLFFAGQINGTSGYEEAAGQGLLAGLNAARFAAGDALVTLGREQAYIGVMMDDLVTKTPVEPYRMFTSRAEHRLLLRADNAADRLTPAARSWGLVGDERWRVFEERTAQLAELDAEVEGARARGERLRDLVKRPGYTAEDLRRDCGGVWPRGVATTVHADRHYAGYIARQHAEVKRHAQMERRAIPTRMDYDAVPGLRTEARQALARFRPATFGQASRLEGVNPADISLVHVQMKRMQVAGVS